MSELAPPEISIIVVSFNEGIKTANCFQSIRARCPLAREIIWVDNGSKPEEFGIMRRAATRPRMRTKLIKFKDNRGFIQGVNAAIPEIDKRSKYVAILNNDCEVGNKTFTKLVKPMVKDKKVGAVGPITQSKISWQEAVNLNRRWSSFNIPPYCGDIDKYTSRLENRFKGKYIDVGSLNLAFFCTAFRKDVFVDGLQGLEESFGIGLGEDDYACHVLRHFGFKLYLALDAFVFHHHRTTFKALNLGVDSIRRHNLKVLKRRIRKLKKSNKFDYLKNYF